MAYPNQSTTTRETIERGGDATSSLAQKAGNTAKSVGRDVSDAFGQAADVAHDQLDTMTKYVRKNPLQATAIAAGIGFVFALIAQR